MAAGAVQNTGTHPMSHTQKRPESVLQPGTVVAGKYQVECLLGEGGMGFVVKALHLQLNQPVALKFLHPHLVRDETIMARFLREAQAVSQLRGQHAVRVLDVDTTADRRPYLVMEFLEGVDLAALVASRGPLSVSEAVDYILHACDALAEAHRRGIIHRDLKPANLFLSADYDGSPVVKVLDFGISKLLHPADHRRLTASEATMGSPRYMSPEQMEGARDVDHRTDIWALGAILYELLAGRPAFAGENLPEVVTQVMSSRTVPIRDVRTDLHPGLEAVIDGCLRVARDERFASVEALGVALVAFSSVQCSVRGRFLGGLSQPQPAALGSLGQGERVSTVAGPPSVSSPVPPKVRWQAIGIVLTLAVVGIGLGRVWSFWKASSVHSSSTNAGVAVTHEIGETPEQDSSAPAVTPSTPVDDDAQSFTRPSVRWVKIGRSETSNLFIGLQHVDSTAPQSGFRPGRMRAPFYAYELQSREVTFEEFEAWVQRMDESFHRPAWAEVDTSSAEPDRYRHYPAAGMTWMQAEAYCLSLGGKARLPTEAEWEFAARGPDMRPFAWGEGPLDLSRVHAFQGPDAIPMPVVSREFDRAETDDGALFDMMGNVQEWTSSVCRGDTEAQQAAIAAELERGNFVANPCRVVRGLPLREPSDVPLPTEGAAVRQLLAIGILPNGKPRPDADVLLSEQRETIGFRCARSVTDHG